MILLAIETSAKTVVGLVENGSLIREIAIENRDSLPLDVAALLRDSRHVPADVTAIALGIGPGSFTGLRVGAAFAKGFARGSGCAIWPVSSLQTFAANVEGQSDFICAISPARKNVLHMGLYRGTGLHPMAPERVIPHEELGGFLSEGYLLVGPGIFSLTDVQQNELKRFLPTEDSVHRARALHLARLAKQRWENQNPPEIRDIVPVYGLEFGQ